MCDRAILSALRGTRAAAVLIMPWFERAITRWSGRLGRLVGGAITVLTSVAHRVGAPTLLGVPVSAAILTRVVAVQSEQSLDEVAQLFIGGRHDLLPVLDHGRPVAAITRRDVADGLERVGPHAAVGASASHHVITVTPTEPLENVLQRLHAMPDAVAVVVDRGGPVGLVTEQHLIAYLDGAGRGNV
jgi:CBS domain-containing protein